MIRFLLVLAALLAILPGIGAAQAPPAAPPPITREAAENALTALSDPAKRAQLIGVLEAIVHAVPPPAQSTPPAAQPAGSIPLAPDSVAAQVLSGASQRLSKLTGDIATNAEAIADFPTLGHFLVRLATNADLRQQVLGVAWRLLLVLAVGLLAAFGVRLALHRPAAALCIAAPQGAADAEAEETGLAEAEAGQTEKLRRKTPALLLLQRLPFALGHFLLDILPALALLVIGYVMVGAGLADSFTTRLVIIGVVHATVACWLLTAVMRLLVSPGIRRLRMVPMSDAGAAYLVRWTRRLAALVLFGSTAAEIGLLFGLYHVAYDAALKLVSMVTLLCLVIIVLQTRTAVARRIRAPDGQSGWFAVLRNRTASVWHVVALFYLVALWVVWALAVPNGFSRLLRVVVSTIVVVLLARLIAVAAYGALYRTMRVPPATAARHPGLEARVRRYQPIARTLLSAAITALAGIALFQSWGVDAIGWFASGALGGQIVGALGSIGTTLVLALVVWEAANGAIQLHLARLTRDSEAARSARLRTLLPMLRTTLLVSICTVAGLMVLSDIGVNIAPLLAGAGVVGLAIGFGSQKLVQDIITGLFLLLENTMQVGDVVSLGGLTGTVEALSIRTIRLRALDGSVHIVPFSAVTSVTNQTRDFGYAVVDVSVGLNEDPEHVADLLRAVAREMRQEPRWQAAIRDELDVMGVDSFLDTALVLRTRTKTVASQRWAVARELNQRIKARFDELAVESPWTSHRVLSTAPSPPPATE
jgi:small-conductance mechanosensitive channel